MHSADSIVESIRDRDISEAVGDGSFRKVEPRADSQIAIAAEASRTGAGQCGDHPGSGIDAPDSMRVQKPQHGLFKSHLPGILNFLQMKSPSGTRATDLTDNTAVRRTSSNTFVTANVTLVCDPKHDGLSEMNGPSR